MRLLESSLKVRSGYFQAMVYFSSFLSAVFAVCNSYLVILGCFCVLFCCVGELVEEFLVECCFELGSFSYAWALVCVGEGVSVVSEVFELEGIESAD